MPLVSSRLPTEDDIAWVAQELSSMVYFYQHALEAPVLTNNGLLNTIEKTVQEYRQKSVFESDSFALPAWEYIHDMVTEAKHAFRMAATQGAGPIKAIDQTAHINSLAAIMTKIEISLICREFPHYSEDEASVIVALNPRFSLEEF